MPVEDWIEKWTEMQTNEMKRIERHHGERMDKIERSVEALNSKMDALTDKIDQKMDALTKTIGEKNEKHAVDLAVIKTNLAVYATIAGLVAGAIIAWLVNFFSK